MRLDVLFFLGVFYSVIGTLVLAGWFLTRDPWSLYGGLMLAFGVLLVVVRPRPPLRFFAGRIRPEDRKNAAADDAEMSM